MATTILGEELVPALTKIQVIMDDLPPVQQQQIIEILMATHLYRVGGPRKIQRFVIEAMCKHVWQVLDDEVETKR